MILLWCYMDRETILKKLKTLNFDKKEYVIISGASLVVQGVEEVANDIDISCSKKLYESINWPETIGYKDNEIKVNDVFEIGPSYYDPNNIVTIDGFQFMNLEKCLELKKILNRSKDKKTINKIEIELAKVDNKRFERDLNKKGINIIGGVDEVGRGPLIGPVVACCCVLPDNFELKGLTDSKKISEKKRNEFYEYLIKNTIYGIGIVDAEEIDRINIYEATKVAMKKAINEVKKQVKLEHVLIDAVPLDLDIKSTSIIKGDLKSISISAASVIAKVYRDNMMIELDKKYPEYGFAKHKGYPTKKHIEAIKKYGLIDGYRKSYGPIKEILEK